MDKGWISVHRKIRDCDIIWNDKPFSRGQAWLDLLLMVNHEDKEFLFNGTFTKINRGQTLTSLRKLSDQWGWSRKKTTKFLNELKMAQMLDLKSTTQYTIITLINYDFYQDVGTTKEPQKSHRGATEEPQRNTNNNELIMNNNENKNNVVPEVEEVISYLNRKANKNFKSTTADSKKHISARLKEGFTVEDLKTVIDVKTSQWLGDPKMDMYLRPSTLFNSEKFQGYLNEAPRPRPQPKKEEPEDEELSDEEFARLVESGAYDY